MMDNLSAHKPLTHTGHDWMELARSLAKAERELKIEHWVCIAIEYRTKEGERIRLHTYDLPRNFTDRYQWVIRWRVAKLQCRHPRESIQTYYSYYDKRTGMNTGFNSALSKLAAAKAQITRAEKAEKQYIWKQQHNNLFFEEHTDEMLLKFRDKLACKKKNYSLLETSIRQRVKM